MINSTMRIWLGQGSLESPKWSEYQRISDAIIRQRVHPSVISYVRENRDAIIEAEGDFKKLEADEWESLPTLDAWEVLSDYIYGKTYFTYKNCESGVLTELSFNVISRVIGQTQAERYLEHLNSVFPGSFKTTKCYPEEELEEFTMECYKAKLTCLLAGPTMLGKTSIIRALSESLTGDSPSDLNYKEYDEKNRQYESFGGWPGINEYLRKTNTSEAVERVIRFNNMNAPITPSKRCWKDIHDVIVNNELFGIRFNPTKVFIVLEWTTMGGVNPYLFDKDVASKCAVFYKNDFDIYDAKAFMNYLLGHSRFVQHDYHVHPIIEEYFSPKKDHGKADGDYESWNKLKDMISSVKHLTMFNPQPTPRAIDNMNQELLGNESLGRHGKSSMYGSVIFTSNVEITEKLSAAWRDYSEMGRGTPIKSLLGVIEEVTKYLNNTVGTDWVNSPRIHNWKGIVSEEDAEEEVNFTEESVIATFSTLKEIEGKKSPEEVLKALDDNEEEARALLYLLYETLLKYFQRDRQIRENRRNYCTKSLGEEIGAEFEEFFTNKNF